MFLLLRRSSFADRDGFRVRMNATLRIQKSILVGIIGRAGAHKFCDERALAGKSLTRNYDGPATPSYHACVDKELVRGVFRHIVPEVYLQRIQNIFQIITPGYPRDTGIEKI